MSFEILPVSASAILDIQTTVLPNSSSIIPPSISQSIAQLAQPPAGLQIRQPVFDVNEEWNRLSENKIDPLLRQFAAEINVAEPKMSSPHKFKQLFYRICDFSGIARKTPPKLEKVSKYSADFYCQLLAHAKQVQDRSLCKWWQKKRQDFESFPEDMRAIPENAPATIIRLALQENQDALKDIKELDLAYLGLKAIPLEIGLFENLSALYLGGNKLQAIPTNFFIKLTKLARIELENNEITYLATDTFSGLADLSTLSLHNNKIITLPEQVFRGLTSCSMIALHANQITDLPTSIFEGLETLEIITLHRNRIQNNFVANWFLGLPALSFITLHENPTIDINPSIFKISPPFYMTYSTKKYLSDLVLYSENRYLLIDRSKTEAFNECIEDRCIYGDETSWPLLEKFSEKK